LNKKLLIIGKIISKDNIASKIKDPIVSVILGSKSNQRMELTKPFLSNWKSKESLKKLTMGSLDLQ